MDNKKEDYMYNLNLEDIIWYVYIFVSVMALISNNYEKKYVISKNIEYRNTFRSINIFIFIIALFIYGFFISRNIREVNNSSSKVLNNNQIKLSNLSLIATMIFFVGGILNMYIEISGFDEELEI